MYSGTILLRRRRPILRWDGSSNQRRLSSLLGSMIVSSRRCEPCNASERICSDASMFPYVSTYHASASGPSRIQRMRNMSSLNPPAFTNRNDRACPILQHRSKSTISGDGNRVLRSESTAAVISSDQTTDAVPRQADTPPPSSPSATKIPTHVNKSAFPTIVMEARTAFRYLELETFAPDELGRTFDRIIAGADNATISTHDKQSDSGNQRQPELDVHNLALFLEHRIRTLDTSSSDNGDSGTDVGTDTADNDEANNNHDVARRNYAKKEAYRIVQLLHTNRGNYMSVPSGDDPSSPQISPTIGRRHFCDTITQLASTVDRHRSAPVVVSMLLTGASVGVVAPAMPFVVANLQLSPAQFGLAVSAFGLAKMLGNVPAAVLVERHGRKPYMTYSLAVIAVGVGGIGLASSLEELYLCRLLTGLGVAALSTAGTLMMTDFSTPLNRASTFAPVMSAFAAGTALGPAIGGFSVDALGLEPTFYAVGISYLGLAAVNQSILRETASRPMVFPWHSKSALKKISKDTDSNRETVAGALTRGVGQWVPLLKDPSVRSVMIMNGIYWVALSGSQMTLLPLILTDISQLAFSATQVGQVYTGMALVQIVGNPIFAAVSDSFGKAPVIVGATALIGGSMAMLPYVAVLPSSEALWPLAGVLGVWSMGSSMLSTAPLAYVSDKVDEGSRAQAIALLRTCGDVGFLIGATGTGALADIVGMDTAMQSGAGLLLAATGWFAARHIVIARLNTGRKTVS